MSESSGADAPIEITDSNIEANVKKNKILVVDCWAPWCGPCRMIAPIIEELAKEFKGKVAFGKLNTDENMQVSMTYGIRSIPTLLYFKNGELANRTVGMMPKEMLAQQIKSLL